MNSLVVEKIDGEWVHNMSHVTNDPPSIQLFAGGEVLVTISPKGELTYGPNYKPDDAARSFWSAMAEHSTGARIEALKTALANVLEAYDYQDPDWGPIDHPKRALTEARKLVLP